MRGVRPKRRIWWLAGPGFILAIALLAGESARAKRILPGQREPLAATLPAAATQPLATVTAAELDRLIGQLASDSWRQRQEAEDQLIQYGPQAAGRLQELTRRSEDEEVRTRAQSALALIEENRLLGPTVITLHVKDASAGAAFTALAAQAGLDLVLDPPELWQQLGSPKVTIDAERSDYWVVLRDLCRQAGVEPELSDNSVEAMKLHLTQGSGDWCSFPAVASGTLLIAADSLTRTNSVRFSMPDSIDRSCSLQLNVYTESKVHLLHDSGVLRMEEATDNNGNQLLSSEDQNDLSGCTNGHQWNISINLKYPPGAGDKIARLKGAMYFLVPTKTESVEIADIMSAKNVRCTCAGREIVVHKMQKNQNVYELHATVVRGGLNDQEWQELCNPHDLLRLLDENGHVIPFNGMTESEGGEKQVNFTLTFDAGSDMTSGRGADKATPAASKPAKLVLQIPTETREMAIPFEFTNLTLP